MASLLYILYQISVFSATMRALKKLIIYIFDIFINMIVYVVVLIQNIKVSSLT